MRTWTLHQGRSAVWGKRRKGVPFYWQSGGRRGKRALKLEVAGKGEGGAKIPLKRPLNPGGKRGAGQRPPIPRLFLAWKSPKTHVNKHFCLHLILKYGHTVLDNFNLKNHVFADSAFVSFRFGN